MKNLMLEVKKQTLTLMVAALGFVAALVWKDAISAWFAPLISGEGDATGLTTAALVVTIVVVLVTIVLTKVLGDKEK